MRIHKWTRWEYGYESDEMHPTLPLNGGAWMQPVFSMYFDRVWEWLLYCDRGEYLYAPTSERTSARYWAKRADGVCSLYADMAAEFDEGPDNGALGCPREFRPFLIDVWDHEVVGKRVFVETLRWIRDSKLRSPIPVRLRLAGGLQGLARFYHRMPESVADLAPSMGQVCGFDDEEVAELDRYCCRTFTQKMLDEELQKGM